MVQTPISSASRRIAEALLLCRAQDSVLVRGAKEIAPLRRERPGSWAASARAAT